MPDLKTLQYPRHVHRDGQFRIVASPEDCDQAMDAGWVLSPGDTGRTPKPAPEPAPAQEAEPEASVLDGTGAAAIAEIKTLTDVGELQAMAEVEANGKNRKTVLAAIEARIASLESTADDADDSTSA